MPDREFDVVLYGASGFTGRQTVRHFAKHAPDTLRWAIAGRNRERLEALNAGVPAIVASVGDQATIDAMAARTRVMLSTAGPFALYSDGVVDACVRHRTHYVDITGETIWVRSLIDRFDAQAARDGTRIIPCCGFDCVPCDVGANWIAGRLGPGTVEVKAFFQVKGGKPNGGTIASALHTWETGGVQRMRDPFLLSPGVRRPLTNIERDPTRSLFDRDAASWVAPWIMASIDTRVVRRSNAILGRDFAYQEYTKCSSQLQAFAIAAFSAAAETSLKLSPVRGMLRRIPPGSGPSEREMDEGWIRCEFFARAADGRTARAILTGRGDPANRITVKCVCESALALACDMQTMAERAGVLTPSTGIGDSLLTRLARHGITIEGKAN